MIQTLIIAQNQDYKTIIDTFFINNTKEIMSICKKSCVNSAYNPNDLFAEVYTFLIEKEDKITQLIKIEGKEDKPLMRYIAQWCYNNIRLYKPNSKSSNFKAKYRIREFPAQFKPSEPEENTTYTFTNQSEEIDTLDVEQLEEIDLKTEEKLKSIEQSFSLLTEVDKKLFNDYIIDNLCVADISRKYKISPYSASNLVNSMTKTFFNNLNS